MKFVPKTALKIASGVGYTAVGVTAVVVLSAANNPPPPGLPPPPGTPIDGGIIVLMIVATVFGLYKIYQAKNKKAPM